MVSTPGDGLSIASFQYISKLMIKLRDILARDSVEVRDIVGDLNSWGQTVNRKFPVYKQVGKIVSARRDGMSKRLRSALDTDSAFPNSKNKVT